LLAAAVVAASSQAGAAPPAGRLTIEELAATRWYTLGMPRAFAVTRDGRSVVFLRGGPRTRVQKLFVFDVASGQSGEGRRGAPKGTRLLADAESLLGGQAEELSPAERARRERQRITTRGIATFVLAERGDLVLVPLSGSVFVLELGSGKAHRLAGVESALDARFSPDGRFVSFLRDHDLYVSDWRRGRVTRLTRGGSEVLTHGEAEFVAQEEMDRSAGYWWSPDSTRVAFEEADHRKVERRFVPDPAQPYRTPVGSYYPRPGTPNARVRLGLVSVRGGAPTWVRWDERYEYLATVKWSENAPLSVAVQTRDQRELVLLRVDPRTGATRTLLGERDPAWINLRQSMPWWLAGGRQFLWMTERDGEWRVWLHEADGRAVRSLNPGDGFRVREVVHVDETRGTVIVSGGTRTPETHLFELPLAGGPPRALTKTAGVHTWTFGRKSEVHVRQLESARGRGPVEVHRADGSLAGTIESAALRAPMQPRVELTRVGEMEALLVRPVDFKPGRRYPVLVDVYAGPHLNMVMQLQRWHLINQWFADHGLIVVSMDGRGTPGRGRAWERAIRGDFSKVPLEDQVRALSALGARYRELDLGRVGVFGISFGGYMAALAVARRPDLFRAAVAVAPAVDWTDYDTHYTERYLGVLPAAAEAYRRSGVLTHLGSGVARPILIVHGTADDNVSFANSLKLADALFRRGRPFELLPVVGETHLYSTPGMLAQMYRRIAAFLTRELR
jgi:dipeptidyl-peptidase 4